MNPLSLLYPNRCPFCRARTGEPFCLRCQETLPWAPQDGGAVRAPLYYRDAARKALHRFKFEGAQGYARVFGLLMSQCVRAGDYDLVTYVPSSLRRRLTRGYDQSRLLARRTAHHLGLPLRPLLRRVRHGVSQFSLTDPGDRERNVAGAFAVTKTGRAALASGPRVLLVDDIHTTGATYRACGRVLLEAGAVTVTLLCAARKK